MRITPGGPADKAGLQKGDLITALSGIRVRQLTEVADILEQLPPESKVTFFVRRGRADQLIDVTLGHRLAGAPAAESPPQPRVPPTPKAPQPAPPIADIGAQAQIDALLQRIEALERDVQALKEQNRRLEERIGALQRPVAPPVAPKPPTP
jgi:membrane-associated protease RseP (regulator of RpoE activity)